jgi:hypothetical protein
MPSGILGLHLEGNRFVVDSMTRSDAAAALQALADSSAAAQEGSDTEEQASEEANSSSWDDWLKYFVGADAAAGTQQELTLQMQVDRFAPCIIMSL